MSDSGGERRKPGVGVGVLVLRDGEIAMVRRKHHGEGSWSTPGGYLDPGETPEACAAREVEEEIGVRIAGIVFRGITNDIHRDGKHNVTIWLSAGHADGEARVVAADEVSEVRWFPVKALPQPLYLSTENFVAGRSLPADAYQQVIDGT